MSKGRLFATEDEDRAYEQGYANGENSKDADWIMALDRLPINVDCPEDVIRFFSRGREVEVVAKALADTYGSWEEKARVVIAVLDAHRAGEER